MSSLPGRKDNPLPEGRLPGEPDPPANRHPVRDADEELNATQGEVAQRKDAQGDVDRAEDLEAGPSRTAEGDQ